LENNPKFYSHTMHIRVKLHYIKDMVESSEGILINVMTRDNVAYALTMELDGRNFTWCKRKVGLSLIMGGVSTQNVGRFKIVYIVYLHKVLRQRKTSCLSPPPPKKKKEREREKKLIVLFLTF
jgi:hypothetical protein